MRNGIRGLRHSRDAILLVVILFIAGHGCGNGPHIGSLVPLLQYEVGEEPLGGLSGETAELPDFSAMFYTSRRTRVLAEGAWRARAYTGGTVDGGVDSETFLSPPSALRLHSERPGMQPSSGFSRSARTVDTR